ncbi:MAG: flagellar biosynthetic protein FliQ [Oligoflexia bacterium]|nr:flagellar biosynthetic protein FliQ [Oligoflexia bacterium]
MGAFFQHAVLLVGLFSLVPLAVVGVPALLVSLLQAATQIQDQTWPFLIRVATFSLVAVLGWQLFSSSMLELLREAFRLMLLAGR